MKPKQKDKANKEDKRAAKSEVDPTRSQGEPTSSQPNKKRSASQPPQLRQCKKFRPATAIPPESHALPAQEPSEGNAEPQHVAENAQPLPEAPANATPAPKPKAKSKSKAKAKAKAMPTDTQPAVEPTTTNEAPKRRARPVFRPPAFTPNELDCPVIREIVENDLAKVADKLTFTQLKEHLAPTSWVRTYVNVYWTRAQVGLRVHGTNEQICSLSFGMSNYAISLSCAMSCTNLVEPLLEQRVPIADMGSAYTSNT